MIRPGTARSHHDPQGSRPLANVFLLFFVCLDFPHNKMHFYHTKPNIIVFGIVAFVLAVCLNAESQYETHLETNKLQLLKKDRWLKDLLSRTKRSSSSSSSNIIPDTQLLKSLYSSSMKKPRPCPSQCNCYEAISCNELIAKCVECEHWSDIHFNQINQMQVASFRHFHLAPNKTTHIIIYKLMESALGAQTFQDLVVPTGAQLEITFQYNSVVKFNRHVLQGARLNANSTLIFNFPYTTQVVFAANSFDGVYMKDANSRLIIRIINSFSVRFLNDLLPPSFYYFKTSPGTTTSKSVNNNWSINTGQLIFDIKSTQLVKFEENALSDMQVTAGGRVYFDFELIEKLMLQRNAFGRMRVSPDAQLTIYAKHLTFVDFRAFSFADMEVRNGARVHIYLEDLMHSLCVQRDVFHGMRLVEQAHFNLSIINSKNVMLMHDTFSSLSVEGSLARLYVGVYNGQSYQLSLHAHNYYREFLRERLAYKSLAAGIEEPGMFQINSEYLYNPLEMDQFIKHKSLHETASLNKQLGLETFFLTHKQAHTRVYNLSIEQNCFSNVRFSGDTTTAANESPGNIWIVADNLNTLLVDDLVFNHTNRPHTPSNLNLLLNVESLALSSRSLNNVNFVQIEFLKPPAVFKFGLQDDQVVSKRIRIVGLGLNEAGLQSESLNEQDVELAKPVLDDYCHLAFAVSNTKISLNNRVEGKQEVCSCETVYLQLNQLETSGEEVFECSLRDANFVTDCRQALRRTCQLEAVDLLKDYVKYWESCISEVEPHVAEVGNYADGMFSASHQDSAFFEQNDSMSASSSVPPGAVIGNMGKLVGVVIFCCLAGIILFMVIINIIQYKFRNDLLDDLDYASSQQFTNTNSNGSGQDSAKFSSNNHRRECYDIRESHASELQLSSEARCWKKTFSVSSLKRTLSSSSLKHAAKRDKNNKVISATEIVAVKSDYYDDDDESSESLSPPNENDKFFDDEEDENHDYGYEDEDDEYEERSIRKDNAPNRNVKGIRDMEANDSGNPSEVSPINSNRISPTLVY